MPEIRYEAALSAAWQILAVAGIPATPELLSCAAYTVLEAIYEAESRLADLPKPLFCGGCLLSLHPWPGEASRPCPRCDRMMYRPDAVGRN